MATRAQMIADINASRPDPYAHLTEEQLMAMLNHTDPKLRDAARQILASRKPKESTTADLVNETRPIPEVAPVDEGWKGGKFDWSAANREVATAQADAGRREDARQERLNRRAAAQASSAAPVSSPADLDPVEAAATAVTPDPQVGADMSSTDVLPGPRPGTVRKWNPTTKRYDIVDASTPVADEPAPFYGRTVPGPVSINGTRSSPSEVFASQEDADAYDRRSVLGPDEAAPVTVDPLAAPQVNPRTGLAGSQRDIAMRRRGFVPVQGRDGNITYMLEADTSGETVGGPGRAGVRDDLGLAVNDDGSSRWEPQTRNGPLGTQTVYAPTDAFRKQVRDNVQARSAARAARDAERQKMVVMQAQATQRPMNFLNNPNADPWAKRVLSEAMLRSGRPGATPLDVEGQQMQNMQDIAKQLAVGALQAGPAQAQLDAAERVRREQRIVDMRKTAGPFMDSTWYSPAEARRRAAAALRRDHGASPDEIDMILGPAPSERQPNDGRVDGRSDAPAAPRENPF